MVMMVCRRRRHRLLLRHISIACFDRAAVLVIESGLLCSRFLLPVGHSFDQAALVGEVAHGEVDRRGVVERVGEDVLMVLQVAGAEHIPLRLAQLEVRLLVRGILKHHGAQVHIGDH